MQSALTQTEVINVYVILASLEMKQFVLVRIEVGKMSSNINVTRGNRFQSLIFHYLTIFRLHT